MFGLNGSTQYIIEVSSFYDCTTKQVIAVRLKSVVTRLSRGADCSQQTC